VECRRRLDGTGGDAHGAVPRGARQKEYPDVKLGVSPILACVLTLAAGAAAPADAQTARPTNPAATPAASVAPIVPSPPGYVIGPDDVLNIVFWREAELSAEVAVRPDGMISLPLLNDVLAGGLTPDQLRDVLTKAARKFVEEPTVTVVVKQVNSRKVYITGQVSKPGPYPLVTPMTVMQLIAMAGGILEYANAEDIVVMRTDNGVPSAYRFNYKDVIRRKNLRQNIELRPGDTVVVP
jgi:polysaccharide export outer membrane protein